MTAPPSESDEDAAPPETVARRTFLGAILGIGAGTVLLGTGIAVKVVQYLRRPDMSPGEQSEVLEEQLARLRETTAEGEQKLERLNQEYILVSPLSKLSPAEGKYFIDYHMRPALAFADDEGLPLLISAKCTHLGCTVSNEVDDNNRISCPCHISWFDIKTGRPNDGSPAKLPLPHLGWVLKDEEGKIVASKSPRGKIEGTIDMDNLESYSVYIAKRFGPEEA